MIFVQIKKIDALYKFNCMDTLPGLNIGDRAAGSCWVEVGLVTRVQGVLKGAVELGTELVARGSSCDVVVVVVVVVVVGQTVWSISSRTLAYDCLCTLELCTASMIATS